MNFRPQGSIAGELGDILDAIGYRLGTELFYLVNPVIKSANSLKTRFTDGFKRGWMEAKEAKVVPNEPKAVGHEGN